MADITKTLNTRIGLKIDTLENWEKSTLGLLKGEIAIATVAAAAGYGLTEPVCMIKIGEDGVKTFKDLQWNFYAKASDVLTACKSEDALKTFINGVIADAKLATADALSALDGRVTTAEGEITKLKGDASTEGSVAKAIKDAIDALDLANTYVAIEDGKSLVDDDEITKLEGVSEGANKVEASTNGNIKIDGVDTVVYVHPDKHAIADVDGLQDALDGKQAAGDYAAEVHTHVKEDITDFAHTHTASEITDFATEVAKVKVDNAAKADEATKATQDGNGKVIADTYAEKATTLAGYGIGDAYTKDEVDDEIEGAINTFVSAYIASDGGAIDKLQEIANWIDSDKDGAADIIADIENNAEGIENLGDRMDAVEEELETYGDIVTHNISEFYTKEQADAAFTDSTEVDGQIDVKIEALALGTMSKETATDYVKKSEAVGYDDILTKTEAQDAYQAKGEYYTKSEADAAFTDSTEVDNQIDAKINTLVNEGQVKTNTDAIASINDETNGILAQAKAYADGLNHEDTKYTAATDGGLKLDENNAFSIDDSIVWIFDCGNSGVTA